MKKIFAILAVGSFGISLQAQTVYVDFSNSASGDSSGIVAGNYWNVWNPGDNLDLFFSAGNDSGWNLDSTSASSVVNDYNSNDYVFSYSTYGAPSPFNDDSIVSDALNLTDTQGTRNVRLFNLDPTKTYNIQIFGTRETATTRVTDYTVTGSNSGSGSLTTSGSGIGTGGGNYNNDTVLEINGISPDANDRILVEYTVNTGGFGYLTAITVSEVPEPSSALLFAFGLGTLVLFRRKNS
jgi:hypothetical protein